MLVYIKAKDDLLNYGLMQPPLNSSSPETENLLIKEKVKPKKLKTHTHKKEPLACLWRRRCNKLIAHAIM